VKLTRRPSSAPVSAALLALLLPLTACGGVGGDWAAPVVSPTPEERPAERALSGFVRLAENSTEKAVFLTFHNVDDGTQKLLVDLTELTARSESYVFFLDPSKFAFSADFRHAAYETSQGEIRLGELVPNTHAYQVTATLAPEEEAAEDLSYLLGEEVTISYRAPQFSPDGSELWFEEYLEPGEEESRVLAVPTDDPLGAPPEERGLVPREVWPLHQYEGLTLTKGTENVYVPEAAYAVTPDNELQVLTEPVGGGGQDFHFLTDGTRVASKDFLPDPSGRFVGLLPKKNWGVPSTNRSTLWIFNLAPDGTPSDDEVITDAFSDNIQRLWVDTDGNRYVVQSGGAYHALPFGARRGEPQELFSTFTPKGRLAEAATSTEILGIFPARN